MSYTDSLFWPAPASPGPAPAPARLSDTSSARVKLRGPEGGAVLLLRPAPPSPYRPRPPTPWAETCSVPHYCEEFCRNN